MAGNEVAKVVNHLDDVNKVATEYLKGFGPTEIADHLGMARTRVVTLLADWRAMVSSNDTVHARAREALAGADQHYGLLIQKSYEVIDVADETDNLVAKTGAIKLIADIEAKRIDMLHRAGLLDNKELAEDLAKMEEKHDIIMNLLKDIAKDHPEVKMKILKALSKANNNDSAIVLDGS